MDEDNLLPFSLPAVCRKKVSVAFDGGLLSSDGGVMLLRDVERRVGLAERLAGGLTDRRDPARTDHELIEMLRLRMFLIAAGLEDGDDCDTRRRGTMFKPGAGRRHGAGLAAAHVGAGERAIEDRERADDGGNGRFVLRELGAPARRDHARHRRHARPGPWAPATLALQCTL